MAQKTYTELETQANEIKNETDVGDNTAARVGQMLVDFNDSKSSREFNRPFSETLAFDKNVIEYASHTAAGDITFQLGAGNLVDEDSSIVAEITFDGNQSINFVGTTYLYGITNGQIMAAGTYEIYLLYSNGKLRVNVPGVSSQGSGANNLSTPQNFAAVADGENAINLSWTDVANESSYLIEFSLTGTGGWTTLDTPAANAIASTQTGLNAGDKRFYRIKAIGDGVSFLDSAFSTIISGQTESGADVTAPTFTFDPLSGVTDWTVNRPITITANEPIRNTDGTEITSANVATRLILKETNSGGADITFTATIDGTKTVITITPTTQYGEAQLVYVAINNVEDVNGNEVTVAVSSTFTTTDLTFFNGTSNRLRFGDILDVLFAATDTNFWIELTISDPFLTGQRPLVTKYDISGNQRSLQLYHNGTDVYFGWVGNVNGGNSRVIKWTGAIDGSEQILVLKYDGSNDNNDGLDRVTLLVDGAIAGSKSIFNTTGPLLAVANASSQLAVGAFINGAGNPVGSSFYSGEAKDFIIRSANGTVVEINVPNLKTGLDTSGNARNGTWV